MISGLEFINTDESVVVIMDTQTNNAVGCPKLSGKCLTPHILWHQTDNAIFIRIMLTDVQKYHIKVECDSFKFRYNILIPLLFLTYL